MGQQVQLGTDSGIVSREAVKQLRMLIADIAAGEKRRPADDPMLTRVLGTRRHNLMDTIAWLEDRLGSIEKIRSRGHGGHANSALHHPHRAR